MINSHCFPFVSWHGRARGRLLGNNRIGHLCPGTGGFHDACTEKNLLAVKAGKWHFWGWNAQGSPCWTGRAAVHGADGRLPRACTLPLLGSLCCQITDGCSGELGSVRLFTLLSQLRVSPSIFDGDWLLEGLC